MKRSLRVCTYELASSRTLARRRLVLPLHEATPETQLLRFPAQCPAQTESGQFADAEMNSGGDRPEHRQEHQVQGHADQGRNPARLGRGLAPEAKVNAAGQGEDGQGAEADGVAPQGAQPPAVDSLGEEGYRLLGDVLGALVQGADDAVGALDLHLPHAAVDLAQVHVALGLEALAFALVLDGNGGVGVVDGVEAAGGQALLAQGALPGGHHVLGIIFPRRGVQLIEDVKELARVRPADGFGDQVLEGIAHGPRLRVAGVEEDQHQVG